MSEAYLFNKNRVLLKTEFKNGEVLEILDADEKNKKYLPLFLQDNLTVDNVNKWLKTRKIPDTREGLEDARKYFPGFDRHSNWHMFSLSDQYWFRHKPTEKWEDLNYFTNRYSQEQGKIFFEPWDANVSEAVGAEGPDLTTNGVLKKRWVQNPDGVSYLLKAGSIKYHQEPLSEVMASIALSKIGLMPFVRYDLTVYGLTLCSRCRNFVTQDTEFVPASHLFWAAKRPPNVSAVQHFYSLCEERRILGAKDYITNMVAIDRILCNGDRHFGNFGFIRNADTGEILGFAPLFDFGRAYFASNEVQDKTSKFFGDIQEECFLKFMRKMGRADRFNVAGLKKAASSYPGITEKESEMIRRRVNNVYREIREVTEVGIYQAGL